MEHTMVAQAAPPAFGNGTGRATADLQRVATVDADSGPEPRLGFQQLDLRPPKRRIYPGLPRSLSEVNPGLRGLFAKLAGEKAPWPLYLWGAVGTGKTFAALAFCDMVERARYYTLESLCDDVMRGHRPWEPDPWRDLSRPRPPALWIVDELGERQQVGNLQYTTLKSVLDQREFHANRVGIYISNLGPPDLAALYDDRIASRLLVGSIYRLCGPDGRRRE